MQQIQLNLGDCLEGMKALPDGAADYCFTDPPYGIAYKPGHRKKNPLGPVVNDNLKPREFQDLMDAALAAAAAFCHGHHLTIHPGLDAGAFSRPPWGLSPG